MAEMTDSVGCPPFSPRQDACFHGLLATKAEFLSHSFFTLHAVKQPLGQPSMAVHVYRALDETLFAVDAQKGFRSTKRNSEANAISPTALGLSWTATRLSAAIAQFGALTATSGYGALTNDALRVLASLPGRGGEASGRLARS